MIKQEIYLVKESQIFEGVYQMEYAKDVEISVEFIEKVAQTEYKIMVKRIEFEVEEVWDRYLEEDRLEVVDRSEEHIVDPEWLLSEEGQESLEYEYLTKGVF